MVWFQWATELLIILNFLSFTLFSSSLFRLDHAGAASYCFFASFLSGMATSVWMLTQHPTDNPALVVMAVLPALASGLLFVSAAKVIRSAPLTAIFSPDQPQFVHTTGPYSRIRHPFYTSYILNFFAAAIACGHWAPAVVFVGAASVYSFAARLEELKFSRSPIAQDYEAYKQATSMLFPLGWRRGPR
jgi:protein-S-isoprenylcysteine O-methyltransferase Ste14